MLFAILRAIKWIIVNLIAWTFVLAVLIHPPTFKLLHDGLFCLHLLARIAFLYVRIYLSHATSSPVRASAWLGPCMRKLLAFLAPVLRPILPRLSEFGSDIVRLSPHLLCYVTGKVVEGAKFVVDAVMGEDAAELREMWRATSEELAGFCKASITIWSLLGLW